MRRQVDPTIQRTSRGITSGLGGAFRGVAGIAAGAFAAVGVASFIGDTLDEAREAAKVGRQTAAVIRSTGGAAGLSAKQFGELAESISNTVAVDDEIIQSGENLLATFTSIGEEAFPRATRAAVDLTAGMNHGEVSASGLKAGTIMLGKALNDPIKGMNSLGRAGVGFTDQQKEQIKVLTESGDLLGAQKIIMGEVERQFKGSAEAAADPMQRLGVVVGNLKERIGTALLPVISNVAEFLSRNLPSALDATGRAFGRVREFIEPVTETIGDLVRTFTGGGDKGKGVVIDIAGMFGIAEDDPRLQGFFNAIESIENVIGSVVGFVQDHLRPILITLGAVFATLAGSAAIGAVVSAIGTLVAVLTGPVALVALLVAGVVYAYQEFEAFRNVVNGVVSFFTDTLIPGIRDVIAIFQKDGLGGVVEYLAEGFGNLAPKLLEGLGNLLVAFGAWWYGTAVPFILEKLAEWGRAFLEWIGPLILPFLAKLGELLLAYGNWFYTTALPFVIAKLAEWAKAFIEWITPMIPPFLAKLGELLVVFGRWWYGTAVPAIIAQLARWALEFVAWIIPAIPPMLVALFQLRERVVAWIRDEALPALITQLGRWAQAFADWVGEAVRALPGRLAELLGVVLTFARSVPGKVIDALGNLASDFVKVGKKWIGDVFDGIKEALPGLVGGAASFIGNQIGKLLPGGDGLGRDLAGRIFDRQSAAAGGASTGGLAPQGQRLLSFIRASGVAHSVASGFRPGARTRSGNASYHSMGRALDLVGPNMMAIFNAFKPIAGQLKELIFTPAGLGILNGRPHKFTGGVAADHFDHVHVALAGGGIVKHRPGGIVANLGEGRYDEAVVPLDGKFGQPVIVNKFYVDGKELRTMARTELDGMAQAADDMFNMGVA